MEKLTVSKFVATLYDNSQFVEMIEDISVEKKDILAKFMSAAVPAPSLELFTHEDICWMLFSMSYV